MKKRTVFFYYLNPHNVSAAIATYGYAYSVKNTILMYGIAAAISAACGFLFRLGAVDILALAVYAMAMLPRIMINSYKNMYEQKRFSDVNIYMEQTLYSFKKMPKIITALSDAEKIIAGDSPMRDTIQKAIRHIQHAGSGEHSLEDGLKMIEQDYRCQRLKDAHALMLKTEKIGGDYEAGIKILLSGRAIWETETCKFQKECKSRQRMVNIALALVCAVCLFTPLILMEFAPQVSIVSSRVYRAGTVIMMLIAMYTYIRTDGMAAVNWLRDESALTEEEQRALYRKVKQFDVSSEKKKSLLWSLPPAAISFLFFGMRLYFPAVLSLLVCCILINQHTIGYRLAKKRCRAEIEKAFPQWLMELSLLLQISENVNAAIANSMEEAPVILADALRQMQEEIMEHPESNEPYINFMREFDILEIQSAMGMLYSISSGRGGDAQLQIDEILIKNSALLGQSEKAANENRLAALYWQFLFPSIIGGGKLLVDMTLVTIAFLSVNL